MTLAVIMVPVAALGGMGVLFGGILAYASHKFAVETDPIVTAIRDALPGANCGGCGFPGCDGMAGAIAEGAAAPNGCPVASADANHKIADILGVTPVESEKMVARVFCAGGTDKCSSKFKYYGIHNCKAANMIKGGNKNCKFGCLGYGSCAAVCPFGAIEITENNLARVDYTKCTGCGRCIAVCPKKVISLTPFENRVHVDCNNKEIKKTLSVRCSTGCIGCKQCAMACPYDAIVMENNLARINYDKCQECMLCVEKCPTKAILGEAEKRVQIEVCIQSPKGGCGGCAHGRTCGSANM